MVKVPWCGSGDWSLDVGCWVLDIGYETHFCRVFRLGGREYCVELCVLICMVCKCG